MYLQLHGSKATFEEVHRHLVTGPTGASLYAMRDCAARLGVNSAVLRGTRHDLISSQKPLIAHFKGSEHSTYPTGHYVVVLSADEEHVSFIDGTTAQTKRFRTERFAAFWSGHVLAPSQPNMEAGRREAIFTIGFWSVAGLGWAGARVIRRRTRSLLVVLGIASTSSFAIPIPCRAQSSIATAERGGVLWRIPQNDGLNCLYMLFKLHGKSIDYATLKSAFEGSDHGVSLGRLRDIGRESGLSMSVYKCRPMDLARAGRPVVAFIEGSEGLGGSFDLILDVDESRCLLIDGGGAYLSEVPIDQFRRSWSGYVLAVDSPGWTTPALSAGAGGLAAVGFCCFIASIRRRNRGRTAELTHETVSPSL
jgi:ABC-type bacteriocin/lantibiotic exporter with double-glycine peptidase domain